MGRVLTDIGLDTDADDLRHLGRLAIGGNDSPGGGSTSTLEDEQIDDQDDTGDDGDGEGADGQGDDGEQGRRRGRTGEDRTNEAFRKLQSDLDKERNQRRVLEERLEKIETAGNKSDEGQDRRTRARERAKERARQVVAKLKSLNKDDPNYSEDFYATLYEPLFDELPRESEEISRRVTREEVETGRSHEERRKKVEEDAIHELEEQGLDESYFEDLQMMTMFKNRTDPGWDREVPAEEQIPLLVKELKDRLQKRVRNQKDFKDEKEKHGKPMRGVIGTEGTRSSRTKLTDRSDTNEEGAGSILADVRRNREERRSLAKQMVRDAHR